MNILFRCDSSATIGYGHVARCLVLAKELRRRGHKCVFVTYHENDRNCDDKIYSAGFVLASLNKISREAEVRSFLSVCNVYKVDLIIVDLYSADADYLARLRTPRRIVAAVDDICTHPFPVEFLINHNPGAEQFNYEALPSTVKLLGPKFAILGEEYLAARPDAPDKVVSCENILVSMGGSDPANATTKILHALNRIDRALKIKIVTGGGFKFDNELGIAALASSHKISLLKDLPNLADAMRRCDLLICAGGGTMSEGACLGTPMAVLTIADNQTPGAEAMGTAGAVLNLGAINQWDVEQLTRLLAAVIVDNEAALNLAAANAFKLVDGLGSMRIADALGL